MEPTRKKKTRQEEENEEDLKLPGRKGLEDSWGEKGLIEEDWNDRDKWKKKIIVKWAHEDVETSNNLLYIYICQWSLF